VPFDLSHVCYTTANILDTIPPALLDRLEVIELMGYTQEEKLKLPNGTDPRQLKENGLAAKQLRIATKALNEYIRLHKEAGVRNLEENCQRLPRCCRTDCGG